jgi:hypothetical protein
MCNEFVVITDSSKSSWVTVGSVVGSIPLHCPLAGANNIHVNAKAATKNFMVYFV